MIAIFNRLPVKKGSGGYDRVSQTDPETGENDPFSRGGGGGGYITTEPDGSLGSYCQGSGGGGTGGTILSRPFEPDPGDPGGGATHCSDGDDLSTCVGSGV